MQGLVKKQLETSHYEEMHFTGGLRALMRADGWFVTPIIVGGTARIIGPVPPSHIPRLAGELGVQAVGIDEVSNENSELQTRVWRPFVSAPRLPGDTWQAISHSAHLAGDEQYAKLARNLCVSLRAANIRLRDVSDEYHRQLYAAVVKGKGVGRPFTNVALWDLHLAFHSLLAEMASARDYAAAIGGLHVGAPIEKDSLGTLIAWTKGTRIHLRSDPFLRHMMDVGQECGDERWLWELGEYRNQFLHREPMGANADAKFASLSERQCRHGAVRTLTMKVPVSKATPPGGDAFEFFLALYRRLMELMEALAGVARYPAEFPHFDVSE